MDKSLKAEEFRSVFQNSLKINARTISVKTLLSERNLKRIDYSPYYQRNYVWDNVKQTFFIESVILGTEIPPLVLFKNGNTIEVIDGRQRFETLKRFKENDFSLTIKGLKELTVLSKASFNKLSPENKDIFLNSNIRVFEFEVTNQPDISSEIVDRVKKEIFRRYNTGITPLTKEELDNAKYVDDAFSDKFKHELKRDAQFLREFNECFFPKEVVDSSNNADLISRNVDFIRRFRILNNFPIATYAAGSNRTEIIDLLYDFAKNNTEDQELEFRNFKKILDKVITISKEFSSNAKLANKLIYECILWALTILDKEGVDFDFNKSTFESHYQEKYYLYSEDNNHYYRPIIERYSDTASLFKKITRFDFASFIRSEEFKEKIGELRQTEIDANNSLNELSNLRLHKPNPISTPIDEIRNDLKTTRYSIRPSYQRQEKITLLKASSIIESIILGISLPPIFIFHKKNNLKEVIDGQQRLLAIIGFLGVQYHENGEQVYSKNNNFKLKGLKILTELEGSNYSSLPPEIQDKILDFVIDLIIIEEGTNQKFDPIDLFIRLNYKPYPIKSNSFEMWNSIVNYEIINEIKKEVVEKNKHWFFLREMIDGKPDRMQNEEMITILSYIVFNNHSSLHDGVIGFFQRQDRITCRLKDKKGLGDFLINLDMNAVDKIKYLDAIKRTNNLILLFATLFDTPLNKDTLSEFLNIKSSVNFKRSLQDFYVIWLIINKITEQKFAQHKQKIRDDIRKILSILRNTDEEEVDDTYLPNFLTELNNVIEYYAE